MWSYPEVFCLKAALITILHLLFKQCAGLFFYSVELRVLESIRLNSLEKFKPVKIWGEKK